MKRFRLNLVEKVVGYAGWELLAMRILFGGLMWTMLPAVIPYTDQPVPNGLGYFIDLTFLADHGLYQALMMGFIVAVVLFASGFLPTLTLGYSIGLLTMVGALENSQGAIGHHLQLVCLVGGAMWTSYVWRGRAGLRQLAFPSCESHRGAVHSAKLIIAASYVTSACVKLIASGGMWIGQLPNISLQLLKTHANVYYDTLWPQTGWAATALPHFISEHPMLTRLFFTPGLVLELAAFVVLLGRRAAFFIGVGLLSMHLLIRLVMNLSFSAHEWLLLIFLINLPYLVWRGLKTLLTGEHAEKEEQKSLKG